MTKDEAAAKEYPTGYEDHDIPMRISKEYFYLVMQKAFKVGWTQHGDEVMRMATAKSYHTMNSRGHESFRAPFVLLSDLEAIIKSLEE